MIFAGSGELLPFSCLLLSFRHLQISINQNIQYSQLNGKRIRMTAHRPDKTAVILIAASAGLGALFAFVPLLSVVGYEMAAAACLWLTVACGAVSIKGGALSRIESRNPVSLEFAWRLIAGAYMLALPLIIVGAKSFLFDGCKVAPGVSLFLWMTVPTWLHATSAAFLFGRAAGGGVKSAAIFIAYVAATALLSFAVYLTGPAQYIHNVFFGTLSLSGYYGHDLGLPHSFYIYRALVFASSFFFVAVLGLFGSRRRTTAGLAIFVFCLVAVCAAVFPDETGLGSGRRTLNRALRGRLTTPEAVIHYDPAAFSREELRYAAASVDWNIREIKTALKMRDKWKPVVFMYSGDVEMARITGARGYFFSMPWRREVHVTKAAVDKPVAKHELAHAVLGAWGRGIFRAPRNLGLVEGAATAIENDFILGPAFQEEFAASVQAGVLAPAGATINNLGFGGFDMWKSYRMAGGFTGFVFHKYGPEKFRRWYAGAAARAVYGKPLDALNREWLEWLKAARVSPAALRKAAMMYNDSAATPFYKTRCPRVGERKPPADPRERVRSLDGADAAADLLKECKNTGAPRPDSAEMMYRIARRESIRELLPQIHGNDKPAREAALRKALRIDPASGAAAAELALTLRRADSTPPENTLAEIERLTMILLETEPGLFDVKFDLLKYLGDSWLRAGRPGRAIRMYKLIPAAGETRRLAVRRCLDRALFIGDYLLD